MVEQIFDKMIFLWALAGKRWRLGDIKISN